MVAQPDVFDEDRSDDETEESVTSASGKENRRVLDLIQRERMWF